MLKIFLMYILFLIYRSSVAFYFTKTMGCQWLLPVSMRWVFINFICCILVRGLYDRGCVSTSINRQAPVLFAWPALQIAMPVLLIKAAKISWEATRPRWRRPLKVKFWFETLVFLHQIQSLWAVAIVVGSPIQCLFVLGD